MLVSIPPPLRLAKDHSREIRHLSTCTINLETYTKKKKHNKYYSISLHFKFVEVEYMCVVYVVYDTSENGVWWFDKWGSD